MIDASALREHRPDVAATFHPDGQLASVRVTQSADDTSVSITVSLDPARLMGQAEQRSVAVFDPTERPDDGAGAYYDDSDVEVTPAMRYERWVYDWLDRVYDLRVGLELVCSFCGKAKQEVRRLIAGPSVFICDECIALCNEILAEADAAPQSDLPKGE